MPSDGRPDGQGRRDGERDPAAPAPPELKACHAFLDAGDTLVFPALDRYGRSLQDLINRVAELRRRESSRRFHRSAS
ncbi:recombinase family protein [Streptomyces mobaraensis]|uniref:recombinase family protein n=1 Tax=Streptomyces mobaraensis TaxID=35621 RepID=UPI00034539E7|nr:recombinase family protein [Streptomyces mobaraensis]